MGDRVMGILAFLERYNISLVVEYLPWNALLSALLMTELDPQVLRGFA